MGKHAVPVFDGDGHILENDDEIVQYFEGEFEGIRMFKPFGIFPTLDGWARGFILAKGDEDRKYNTTNAKIWGDMLDDLGAEGSVLYPTAGLAYGLMTDVSWATATAQAYNNWLEDRYTAQDSRLYGVGLMPVEDPKAAAIELERCATKRKNFCGMMLPSVTASPKSYGDEFYWPIYEAAERCNFALALHGGPSRGFGFDNFRDFVKVHSLEHPIPLMVQLTDMLFSGVFDAFPKLRVGYLEGGCGWLPFMMDRLNYEYDSIFGIDARKKLKKRPVEYFQEGEHIWVSMELGETSLKYAIDAIGPDRIIYASDYPHEPTEDDITTELPEFAANEEFSLEVRQKLLHDNTKRFYRID